MKIDVTLDYQTILRNEARPVHLMAKLTAPVFDDSAQVVIPLQKPADRQGMADAIARISAGGSTNLMAGWLLGRDELLKAGQDCDKKIAQ